LGDPRPWRLSFSGGERARSVKESRKKVASPGPPTNLNLEGEGGRVRKRKAAGVTLIRLSLRASWGRINELEGVRGKGSEGRKV